MTDVTLTKDQVKQLSVDILPGLSNELTKLINDEKVKLQDELDAYLLVELKPFEDINKSFEKITALISKHNEAIKVAFDGKQSYSTYYGNMFGSTNKINIDTMKGKITEQFYASKSLNSNQLHETLRHKVNAILCTLTGDAYENIVDVVRKKVNINDLFDNRQKFV